MNPWKYKQNGRGVRVCFSECVKFDQVIIWKNGTKIQKIMQIIFSVLNGRDFQENIFNEAV